MGALLGLAPSILALIPGGVALLKVVLAGLAAGFAALPCIPPGPFCVPLMFIPGLPHSLEKNDGGHYTPAPIPTTSWYHTPNMTTNCPQCALDACASVCGNTQNRYSSNCAWKAVNDNGGRLHSFDCGCGASRKWGRLLLTGGWYCDHCQLLSLCVSVRLCVRRSGRLKLS